MNIPFKFTFTGAGTEYGILWNPWGTSPPATAIYNTVLTELTDPIGVSLMPPTGKIELQGFAVLADADGDGACSIGYYDTVLSAFVSLYPIGSTAVAGGGISRDMRDGIHMPLSATKIPCLRYDGVDGAVLTGDLHVIPNPPTFVNNRLEFQPLLDESGAAILDEAGNPLYAN